MLGTPPSSNSPPPKWLEPHRPAKMTFAITIIVLGIIGIAAGSYLIHLKGITPSYVGINCLSVILISSTTIVLIISYTKYKNRSSKKEVSNTNNPSNQRITHSPLQKEDTPTNYTIHQTQDAFVGSAEI